MNYLRKSLAVMVTVSTLAACSNKQAETTHSGVTSLNSAAIMADKTLSPVEKAEKLALAGEQLTTPTGFMYADMVFDQALSLDSTNQRAKFYKAFLATPMTLRGILARVKPLADSNPKTKKQYDEAVSNLPNSGLKTFLFDGTGDIKTEKDIQSFVDDIHNSQDQFRTFLKNNKAMEITLNVNDWAIQGSVQKTLEACAVNQTGDGQFDIKKCDMITALQVKLNRADIEALQQIAAGVQIYTALLTSYDTTGGIAVARKYEGQTVSNKVLWKELSKNADFGKLRNTNALQNIVGMGIDAVAGVRWAVQIQNELCPYGDESSQNRSGYLFSKGLCIKSDNADGSKLEDTLKLVDMVLAGQTIDVTVGQNQEIKTQARPSSILQSPVADLKALRPVFNNCDKVQSVSDDTIGGVFPTHDGNEALASSSNCGN
jgi:hypothetical protein